MVPAEPHHHCRSTISLVHNLTPYPRVLSTTDSHLAHTVSMDLSGERGSTCAHGFLALKCLFSRLISCYGGLQTSSFALPSPRLTKVHLLRLCCGAHQARLAYSTVRDQLTTSFYQPRISYYPRGVFAVLPRLLSRESGIIQ